MTVVSSGLAVLLVVAFIAHGYAAYRVQRPITENGGVILQTHLWGKDGHRGIDFVYPLDTDIYAVASGTVVNLRENLDDGNEDTDWGNFVLIRHDQRHYDRINSQWAYVYSMYLHLSLDSVRFNVGDHVNAGDWIAEVDDTGEFSDGHHLHLQIVVHPDPNKTLEPIFTLDSENRSRNPELWLSPYNGNTGTVVGKVTYTNGDPVGGLYVYGLQKQAGWGYGSSQTYNNDVLKPDDILVENWGTTDVTPGRYHITLSNGSDMGWHDVQAGRITYVGLYPVWLPYVRNNSNGWISTITVRNNSSTFRAQVNTTFINSDGTVRQQRTDWINANASATLVSPNDFSGSAIVVSSEDVTVVAREERNNELNEYNGILASGGSPGWEQVGSTLYAPFIKNHRTGRSSSLFVANVGLTATDANVQFYDILSGVPAGFTTIPLAINSSALVGPDSCSSASNRCSAKITSSNGQPLAIVIRERDDATTEYRATSNAFSAGGTSNFAPLVKKNFGTPLQTTGLVIQNIGTQPTDVSAACYSTSGTYYACGTYNGLPPNATVIFGVTTLPDGFLGSAVVSSSGQQPIVTLIYETGGSFQQVTNAPLSGSTVAYASELYGSRTQDGQTWNSGLTIQNTSSTSTANVTVTYYYASGQQAGQWSSQISPRLTWVLNYNRRNMPGPEFLGSAVVTSDQPVVATISTYHTGTGDCSATYTASNR